MLGLIATVPLAGVARYSISAVQHAEAEQSQVEEVQSQVYELVLISDLRTRLLEERNWSAALGGLEEIGLTGELVRTLTGVDVAAEAASASAAVDAVVSELGLGDVRTELARIRSSEARSLTETSRLYLELERIIETQADDLFENLLDNASVIEDDGDVLDALRVLEAATSARQSVAAEFNRFFGAMFSQPADRSEDLLALVDAESLRKDSVAKIGRLAQTDSESAKVLAMIFESREVDRFSSEMEAFIADSILGPGRSMVSVGDADDLNRTAEIFGASTVTTDLYLELVKVAGEDVERASGRAAHDAKSRNRDAVVGLIVVAVASALVALGATRAIVQPIHRLAQSARRIRDGESPSAEARGPIEVREAAQAIYEAGLQLDLAARQALALAEGDLHAPSLSEAGPGNLGRSLQAAVQNLTASLNEREEFRRRIAHEASHDGLTQLPNRNASLDQLEGGLARTARSDTQLAVLFIDLDGFKHVNDHHGHQAGDAVLRATAQRLIAAVREGDHVGRLGGDEFIVIAEPVESTDQAVALGQRIIDSIAAPIQIGRIQVSVASSIGIALSSSPSADASGLLRDADLAVYQAKGRGRGRVEVCDEILRSEMAQRVDLEIALQRAVNDDEFVLYYQPIVRAGDGSIIGYEALIRWCRPSCGVQPPDSFIPFAERSDLIITIDRWVLSAVADQMVEWNRQGLRSLPVSVNISAKHLTSPNFVQNILGPFMGSGVDLSQLVVEITESALLQDLPGAASQLQHLRGQGVKIAIDDFGTGYTSLAHLRTLPVDILKVDRSFTSDASSVSLAKLIIDTGHLLGASVTAEGIETDVQAEHLARLGADDLQGYLYGRPVPADQLGRTVDSSLG